MEYLEILWDILVSSCLLFGASRILPERVRCDAPEGALKLAVLHALAYRVLFRVGFFLALIPAMILVAIPCVGPYLVALFGLAGAFCLSALGLWIAQMPLSDYEIDSPATAALMVLGMILFRVMVTLAF